MPQGTVKWFNSEKGYGFTTPDKGGNDLFVHYSVIAGSGFKLLEEGAKVSYEATRGNKGNAGGERHPRLREPAQAIARELGLYHGPRPTS